MDERIAETVELPSQTITLRPDDAQPMETTLAEPSWVQALSGPLGSTIDRYVVLGPLGSGAMGVVFAAYDPALDRKLAIKLVKHRRTASSATRARLEREAQALAKLDHPNVVAVHDVGEHDGQVFVAMEFVRGETLTSWARAQARPWAQVLRVFLDAGRGLAAAHSAGLIHRDFKPDNVMISEGGRVRVMDFGLARSEDGDDGLDEDPASLEEARAMAGAGVNATTLTHTGALIGTPAYMAPEQLRGRPASARSDQFSFCVALYEGLYGARPYRGATLDALLEAIESERIEAPHAEAKVPDWLRAVALRGLAPDPMARYATMNELLAALAVDPTRRRRTWSATLIGAVLVAASAWSLSGTSVIIEHDRACADMDRKLEGIWDGARRAQVEAALADTGVAYAAETQVRVGQLLDAHTQRWVAARVDACEATQRGEQSGELLDLRMACLDERLAHVRATVDMLAQADAKVVEHAVEAVASLPSLDRCADPVALRAEQAPPEDPEVLARVAELDAILIEAAAAQRLGKFRAGMERVAPIMAEVDVLDYPPLLIAARLCHGGLAYQLGDYEVGEESVVRAYRVALEHLMAEEAATAATLMMQIHDRQGHYQDGVRWALDAEPLVAAAGGAEERVGLLIGLGQLSLSMGRYDEARAQLREARELGVETYGPLHPRVAIVTNDLAVLEESVGDYDQAMLESTRALELWEQALGPDHPSVGVALSNLGSTADAVGDYAKALESNQRALTILEAGLGPDHLLVAKTLINLGNAALGLERYAEAQAAYERARTIALEQLGPEHPEVAKALVNLGNLEHERGNHDQARRHYEAAWPIWEASLSPQHPNMGILAFNLGETLSALGDHDQGLSLGRQAVAIWEASLGPEHAMVGSGLILCGEALLGLGRSVDAVPELERAVAIFDADSTDASEGARARFGLARARWDAPPSAGRDRERALELAALAREAYAQSDDAEARARVEAWLAEATRSP